MKPARSLTLLGGILSALFLLITLLTTILLILPTNQTNAQSTTSTTDYIVKVSTVLELKLSTCNSTDNSMVEVNIEPTVTGTFRSNCQEVFINTNAPGYTLTARSTGSNPNYNSGTITNAMLYTNPTTITPTPAIPSTTSPISTPTTLTNDTWGFAVEGLNPTDSTSLNKNNFNFNSSYTINNENNTYASLPTTDTTIYHTDTFPLPETNHLFYYAARLTPQTDAGSYATTITYTAIGEEIPPAPFITSTSGTMRGGNTLTINGGNFYGGGSANAITTLTVGGYACYVTSVTDSKAQCTLPTTLAEGTQSIALTTNYGTANKTIDYISDTDFTQEMCSNMSELEISTITDQRNNQTYRIRKMQDGKCWMISNLRYLPEGNAAGTYNLASTTHGDGYMTRDGSNTQSTNNVDVPFYYDYDAGGSTDYTAQTFYGYMYNFYGATAGTGVYLRSYYSDTESSVCPSPFKLPTGGISLSSDFAVLDIAMGGIGSAWANEALFQETWLWGGYWSGVMAGGWEYNHYSPHSVATYWTSSTNNYSSSAFILYLILSQSRVSPGTQGNSKYLGRNIRCVLAP